MRRSLFTALLLSIVGCGGPKPPPPPVCTDSFIGDPSLPPEAIVVVTDGLSNTLVDVNAGDAVPLVRPPQGGQVTYAAARVRNINRCSVQLTGRFRDPTTMIELAFDRRSADLVVGADGWGRPDVTHLSNLANIPLCPDNDPTRDNQGVPALLEIGVADQHGHSVTQSVNVVPTCTAADAAMRALCVCECSHLPAGGRMCSVDGGL
ncbi:MAG TPA: hypothetical protein VF997_12910 [Polyangia bacterium]